MTVADPILPTYITKLVPTFTRHMITTYCQFDNRLTFSALPIMKIILKVLNLVFITYPIVFWKHASFTKYFSTFLALG